MSNLDWDRSGLPAWTYHSKAFLELEREEVFLNHWQLAGHVSDVPEAGDYLSFDLFDERALIVRGKDGVVRAFHNICRHRGSRLVTEEIGHCKNALVCPFHGWVYNLDGTLRGAARPKSFPDLDKNEFGLQPLELDIWKGFIFIRFKSGPQPSVAEVMAPHDAEISPYMVDDLVCNDADWTQVSPVNWKSVRDVDNEGYHVPMAHPALQDLYGASYYDEPMVNGISRSHGAFSAHGGRRWSVRHYLKLWEHKDHLPEQAQKAWVYFGLFPNMVFVVTPETVQFYQDLPVSVDKTRLRGRVYHRKHESRKTRAARFLVSRIDRDTTAEDVQLTIWSNEAMKSTSFKGFYLSDLEKGVRAHHDHIRAILPVANELKAPMESEMAQKNVVLLARS